MYKVVVKYILKALAAYLIVPGVALLSCTSSPKAIENNITFKNRLSEYALFESGMSNLVPAPGVEKLEIAAVLFTDYAEKQRLLKIPPGTKVRISGDGLPVFPDGTLIAKTFFYPKSKMGKKQIIETRLLILSGNQWNAATYQWNKEQTDAELLVGGAIVPVAFEDRYGKSRVLQYQIPGQQDCGTCHRTNDQLSPIGPQARNLNKTIRIAGKPLNQLTYLMEKGVFQHTDISAISSLPDYQDSSRKIQERGRAYLEMNCAHCHQEAGVASNTSLDLRYSTPLENTGIGFNRENIIIRMSTMGEYHMPKIGTTVPDEEGVQLVKDYMKSFRSNP